jgi:hypothetical protein
MMRNAALLTIILLAAPVVAAAQPPNPMAAPPTPRPATAPTRPPANMPAAGPARSGGLLSRAPLPTVTVGDFRPAQKLQLAPVPVLRGRAEAKTLTGTFGGRPVSAAVIHLRGVDGIEKSSGLPEGVKILLSLHVRKLPKGESDHYIINVAQAQEWALTHKVPADLMPTDVKHSDGHSGCKSFSWHCAQESAKHAQDEASRQADILREQGQKDWDKAAKQLTNEWHELLTCLDEDTLHADNIPVNISTAPFPQLTVSGQEKGQTTDKAGSGQVTATIGVGFPVTANFTANVDLFYIPCLPFMVRPKSIAADGTMSYTTKLTGALNADGTYDKTFTIPFGSIPVGDIPVIIFGAPVFNLEISVYFEGDVEVGGKGKLTSSFELDDPHQYAFNFNCDGHGCHPGRGGPPRTQPVASTTQKESYSLVGQAFVKPDIYVALELDLDLGLATVRAGPEPTLTGTLYGCGTATQTNNLTAGHTTGSTESHVLALDLDWSLKFRMDYLVGGTKEGDGYNPSLLGHEHIWLKDLWPGGSNAFVASVTELAQTGKTPGFASETQLTRTGKTTSFDVTMPACYPFTEALHYRVVLPTGATGVASPSSPCSWTGPNGFCTGDPKKKLNFSVLWPAAGPYSLTVVASEDTKLRNFKGVTPTMVKVTVK